MATIYVPRIFGGVVIFTVIPQQPPPINVTWITRDMHATWIARDEKAAFVARDEVVTWKARQ